MQPPNHTVTVTTISNLDLLGRMLRLPPEQGPGVGLQRRNHPGSSQPKPYPGSPETPATHRFPLSWPRCTHIVTSQEETPQTYPGLHQEAPKCRSYQQDPASPSDRQSLAQRRVSPRTRPVPSLGCKDLSCLRLAVPVTQPGPGPGLYPRHSMQLRTGLPQLEPSGLNLEHLPKCITHWAFIRFSEKEKKHRP